MSTYTVSCRFGMSRDLGQAPSVGPARIGSANVLAAACADVRPGACDCVAAKVDGISPFGTYA